MSESTIMFLIIVNIQSSNTETLIRQTCLMMLFHTKYPRVVKGTRLNITKHEIVDVKRNFRLLYYCLLVSYLLLENKVN